VRDRARRLVLQAFKTRDVAPEPVPEVAEGVDKPRDALDQQA
jgi:hypothetical protein